MAEPAETVHAGLLRAVSRWQVVGLAVNDVVGSGIYLLPAAVMALIGAVSVWAVVLAGLTVALLVLCFAEASSYFDQPGGAYLYTREAFGDFVGFEVGWMTWLSRVAALASAANGLVLASAYFWPAAGHGWARVAILCGMILLLAWINVIAPQRAGPSQVDRDCAPMDIGASTISMQTKSKWEMRRFEDKHSNQPELR